MKKITLVIGYPASGKTTVAKELVDKGFYRINRDTTGGSIADQVDHARKALKSHDHVVLDNTYPTRESRKGIIDLGKSLRAKITCLWLQTSYEDAQFNACMRMMDRCGKIIMPDDFKNIKDVNIFPPAVLFKYKKEIETKVEVAGERKKKKINEPSLEEGFDSVEKIKFKRIWGKEYKNSAWIFDADETLRRSTGKDLWPVHPDEVELLPGAKQRVREAVRQGHLLLGVSNQSTCEKKGYNTPTKDVEACFKRTNELIGHDIIWKYCPHYRFPPACFCRKPHVGLGVYLIHKYKLLPSLCSMHGDSKSDETFAKRCGFNFIYANEFLK